MLYRIRFRLIMIFLNLSLANAAQGQWIPQGTNYYNPNDETLNLPSVYVVPPNSNPTLPPQYLFNAKFKSQGDNIFELMSVDELQPEQECSRAEVLSAIPELRLNMTVDEGNALIGCTANINRGQADLEAGLLVNALWTGIDGILHNSTPGFYNPFIPAIGLPSSVLGGSGADWRPAVVPIRVEIFNASAGTSTPFSYTSSNTGFSTFPQFGVPFINLALRENVVESYSYSTGGMTDGAPRVGCGDLQTNFSQLNTGDTFEDVRAKLHCDGLSNRVTVSGDGEQRDYQWQYISRELISPDGVAISRRLSQTVSVSFLNEVAQSFRFNSNESYPVAQECTVEELIAAQQQIQVGDTVATTDLLVCGTRSESMFDDGNTKQTTSVWQTNTPSGSIYTSENRQILVLLRDNTVIWVQLSRF